MTESLSAAEARRIHLAAQSLARRRPAGRPGPARFREYLERQGVLQLDSVNVLARAHHLPVYSRFGPYDRERLDAWLWGSTENFEHWGHEASVMPRDLLPALHHRMRRSSSWKARTIDRLEAERPGLLDQVRDGVEAHGPVTAAELEHLAPRERRRGPWWDESHVKMALEYLFMTGEVAASRADHFRRTYDSPERAWGHAGAHDGDAWALPPEEAQQQLFDRAIAATAIGTVRDLADHFRLTSPATQGAGPRGGAWAASAVERGLASWVEVEGWREPALLATGALDPGRATASSLLSPFDPVCWFRPRLQRMFGVDYRIEIYTPAHKRVFGYYCLLFLHGDRFEARVDLKARRKEGVLSVEATWREPGRAPGSRRRDDASVAASLAAELRLMAGWLGLEHIEVQPHGDLAPALADALRAG
ncbi:crosslink repair DNA glycosylase YcaQ family protein [Demequina sp. SYSU T00192]|uniref:Crosslink repair DNA glycosylase YcaQ family protein n=1 Tax=Demequina litoralis TaxID=3051660 RepID=A0ABT8GCY3_9MICO|nr:crosslink repair DNA glycosylase YcaQ family protein [Demequina sp. SYSU T00192]MDN4477001.1 crosslink repair DNA glycosylase YcaQ family protein [Demequina sp. SYSU T00192]